MAANNNYFIAVIDLDSEKVRGIAGVKNKSGNLEVRAVASADSSAFVERGVIYNLNKAADSIASIVKQLETTLNTHIAKVYTCLGGRSLHTCSQTVSYPLHSETVISRETVDSIIEKNRNSCTVEWDLLQVVPQEYEVGERKSLDPVGIISSQITGHFKNVVARRELSKRLRESFRMADVEIEDVLIRPVALAGMLLSPLEMNSGVALASLDYDTTTVMVYQNNILRLLSTLPIGYKNILLDLSTVEEISIEDAKVLLQKYGSAYTDPTDVQNAKMIALPNGFGVKRNEFNGVIEARVQEIVLNVLQQIKEAGFASEKLHGGLVLTGPYASFRNLDKAFFKVEEKLKLRFAKLLPVPIVDQTRSQALKEGLYNTALAVMAQGKMNCAGNSLDYLFSSEEEPEPVKEDPEVLRRKKEAEEKAAKKEEEERREQRFDEQLDAIRKSIEEDKFKEAENGLRKLYTDYPDKEEQIQRMENALKICKQQKPGVWGVLTRKFGDWVSSFTRE